MTLNFSHRPIFPARLTEDRVSFGMANGEGCKESWHSNHDCFDYGRDKSSARFGSHEPVSNDIIDLLPSDPFGMDINITVTAITGWLEDLEIDYSGYVRDDLGTGDGSSQLFAGLNFIWNNNMWLQTLPGERKGSVSSGFGEYSQSKERENVFAHVGFGSACNARDNLCFRNEYVVSVDQENDDFQDCEVCSEEQEGGPHEALILALGYLDVRDLFAVESVCMSLRYAVQNDPLLWRNIHIEQPLSEKITDDVLLQITCRAQGSLQCLSLVDCQRITDEGLKRVVEENPKLLKLSVPGCTRLSVEGILNSLKALRSAGRQGVKHLRIAGVYGVTMKHFEELKMLLGMDNQIQQIVHKPLFYNRRNVYLSCEDDRAIDIEMCPRCNNVRLVYDCPVEGCQQKGHSGQLCRACTLCIARCVECGQCINDGEYEETFSLELLCSDCWRLQIKP
ncbi:F-box protein SKIP14-like isoform X2 [Hibiscus syriacus]|uniref:F-box protein SKIP14-like isoform X2 n=1 Tax=Hibiscus syriacus TaxID=106335 RepID=UPI001921DCEC|nr:F-box protein SKIP14-like isoform X2 [Hibiscus syriacus]